MLPELAAFDMAGTTIDDHGLVYRALRDAVEGVGAEVAPGDLQDLMGTEKRHAIVELASRGGVELDDAQADDRFAWFLDHLDGLYGAEPPVALPGVEDAFDALRERGIKLALTTGFAERIGKPLVDALGWWDRLDAVVYPDQVPQGRPAPYMLFRCMEATGVANVGRLLAAGDTVADLRAGHNAGARWVIGVLTGQLDREGLSGNGETEIVDGVGDIPTLLGC